MYRLKAREAENGAARSRRTRPRVLARPLPLHWLQALAAALLAAKGLANHSLRARTIQNSQSGKGTG